MDAETPKPGRPCSLNAQRHEQIVAAAKAGLPQQDMARAGGISQRQLREWLRKGRTDARGKFRELFEAVELAKRDSIAKFLAIIEAAGGPQTTTVVKKVTEANGSVRTEETSTTSPGKWQALAWRLERQHPEDFALLIVKEMRDLGKMIRKLKRDREKQEEKDRQREREWAGFEDTMRGLNAKDRAELDEFRRAKQEQEQAERTAWLRDHGILPPDHPAMQTAASAGPPPLFEETLTTPTTDGDRSPCP